MTSPHAGAPTIPVPTFAFLASNLPILRGLLKWSWTAFFRLIFNFLKKFGKKKFQKCSKNSKQFQWSVKVHCDKRHYKRVFSSKYFWYRTTSPLFNPSFSESRNTRFRPGKILNFVAEDIGSQRVKKCPIFKILYAKDSRIYFEISVTNLARNKSLLQTLSEIWQLSVRCKFRVEN